MLCNDCHALLGVLTGGKLTANNTTPRTAHRRLFFRTKLERSFLLLVDLTPYLLVQLFHLFLNHQHNPFSKMSEEGTLEKYVNMGIDRGVEILGLEEIDESQLTDMDDDTNLLIYIRDDGEEDMPSLKHGTWLQVTLYLSVLMVALLLVVAIVYCSKKQEEKSKSKSEGKKKSGKKQFPVVHISHISLLTISAIFLQKKHRRNRSTLAELPSSAALIQQLVTVTLQKNRRTRSE